MRQKKTNLPSQAPLSTGSKERPNADDFEAFSRACDRLGQQSTAGKKNIWKDNAVFRTIIAQSDDCIFLVDRESKDILFANPTLAGLLGYYPESLYDFIGHDRGSVDRSIERIANGDRFQGERLFIKNDGSFTSLEVSAYLITAGECEAVCMVARDISGRKEAEENKRKAERLAALSSLTKGVMHDSANALGVLLNTITLMKLGVADSGSPPEHLKLFREYLADIEAAANQLAA